MAEDRGAFKTNSSSGSPQSINLRDLEPAFSISLAACRQSHAESSNKEAPSPTRLWHGRDCSDQASNRDIDFLSGAESLRYSCLSLIRRSSARQICSAIGLCSNARAPAGGFGNQRLWQGLSGHRVPVRKLARFPRAHAPRFSFPVRSDHVVRIAPRLWTWRGIAV